MEVKNITSHIGEEWTLVELDRKSKNAEYYVSNFGRVVSQDKRYDKWKELRGSMDKGGFRGINYKDVNGAAARIFIHKAVAKYFLAEPAEGNDHLIHIDNNKLNNHYKNLSWVTKEEWIEILKKKGTFSGRKENRTGKNVKLNPATVALLKRSLLNKKTRKKMIAKRFGITHTQLNRIERGENWGDIEPAPSERLKQ